MDPETIKTIATVTVATLAPYTPILLKMGQFSAEAIGEMVVQGGAEKGWDKARQLWEILTNRLGDDKVIEGAVTVLADEPEDKTYQEALAKPLAKRLAQNEGLAEELQRVLGPQIQTNITATLIGDGAQAIGDNNVVAGQGGIAVGRDVKGNVKRENKR
jgi:hypothetical protein